MDQRLRRRIIRDRWGEPITPLLSKPKPQKPDTWFTRICKWVHINSHFGGPM